MPARVPLALIATAALLAGCTSDSGRSGGGACAGANARGGAFCAPTLDGWAILGEATPGGDPGAPVALLVHGLGEASYVFDALAANLLPISAGVVTFDLRGHGASTMRNGQERAWENFTAQNEFRLMNLDIDAVVREAKLSLGDHAFVLVGASIGANLVLRWASDHPTDAIAVALLSPGLDYRGVSVEAANGKLASRALFVASEDDAYSAESARALDAKTSASVHALKIWEAKGHGTSMLDAEGRAFLVEWLSSNGL